MHFASTKGYGILAQFRSEISVPRGLKGPQVWRSRAQEGRSNRSSLRGGAQCAPRRDPAISPSLSRLPPLFYPGPVVYAPVTADCGLTRAAEPGPLFASASLRHRAAGRWGRRRGGAASGTGSADRREPESRDSAGALRFVLFVAEDAARIARPMPTLDRRLDLARRRGPIAREGFFF